MMSKKSTLEMGRLLRKRVLTYLFSARSSIPTILTMKSTSSLRAKWSVKS